MPELVNLGSLSENTPALTSLARLLTAGEKAERTHDCSKQVEEIKDHPHG